MEEKKSSSNASRKIPYFYLPTYSDMRKYGQMGVMTHDGVYQSIHNIRGLHEVFGYGREIVEAGYTLDEFIWEHYIKCGAPKCADCIQNLIITYLSRHSVRFLEEYSEALADLTGKCVLDKIDTSESCVNCIHHPAHGKRPAGQAGG